MNGYNNGSILGFTLSIPSTSMSESGFSSNTLTSQKKPNGLSNSTSNNTSVFTEKIAKENNKSCEAKNESEALVIQDKKQKNTVQDDVDEDYDDF